MKKRSHSLFWYAGIILCSIGVVTALATIVCALLSIWGGDPRWGDTAAVMFITSIVSLPASFVLTLEVE